MIPEIQICFPGESVFIVVKNGVDPADLPGFSGYRDPVPYDDEHVTYTGRLAAGFREEVLKVPGVKGIYDDVQMHPFTPSDSGSCKCKTCNCDPCECGDSCSGNAGADSNAADHRHGCGNDCSGCGSKKKDHDSSCDPDGCCS